MDGGHFSANHLLSRANDMLQSALVRASGSSLSGSDKGGGNGLLIVVKTYSAMIIFIH